MVRIGVLLTLLVACSDPAQTIDASVDSAPQGQPCGAPGMATGTVMGTQVTVVRASAGLKSITLAENPGACGDSSQPDAPSLIIEYCFTPNTGPHTVGALSGWPGCNSSGIGVSVEQSTSPTFKYVATGGTVTVTRSDATCINGTFTVDFGSDQITGAFGAPRC